MDKDKKFTTISFRLFKNNFKGLLEKYNFPIKRIHEKYINKDEILMTYDMLLNENDLELINEILNIDNVIIKNQVDNKNNEYVIFTDGSVATRRGVSIAATAVVISHNDNIICKKTQIINSSIDTNVAEILATISAIKYLEQLVGTEEIKNKRLICYTDSMSNLLIFTKHGYVNSLIGKTNTDNMKISGIFYNKSTSKILSLVKEYKEKLNLFMAWTKGHQHPEYSELSNKNNQCDEMCRDAINKKFKSLGL